MPLYDCMLLVKSLVTKESVAELMGRVARRAYQRNGVVTDLKSFGTVHLAYGIKKLDGRHFKGQLMQMTMMVPPSFTQELHYLNKEDRLLRWLVVKHRDAVYGMEFLNEDERKEDDVGFQTDVMGFRTDGVVQGSDPDEFCYSEDDIEYEVEEEGEKEQ